MYLRCKKKKYKLDFEEPANYNRKLTQSKTKKKQKKKIKKIFTVASNYQKNHNLLVCFSF